jgi:large subunit ribosomal protein L24
MKLKRNDNVIVVRGKYRGKQGRVMSVDRKHDRLVVDGVNIIKKHVRPSPTVRQAGIVEMPGSIDASKVKLLCPACSKAGRLAIRIIKFGEGGEERRRKMRVCKACNQEIE